MGGTVPNIPSPDLRLAGQDYHEGYGGKTTAFVLGNMSAWLAVDQPDVMLLMGATASSGVTVGYVSSDPTVASVAGGTVTILQAGRTTITASQSGSGNYNAATSVSQTLTVNALPMLGLQTSGTNVILSWSASTESRFFLEST